MKRFAIFYFFLVNTIVVSAQNAALPPSVDSFYRTSMSQIAPSYAAWIKALAKDIHVKQMTDKAIHDSVMQYATSRNKIKEDADVLEMLVISAATIDVNKEMKDLSQTANSKQNEKANLNNNILAMESRTSNDSTRQSKKTSSQKSKKTKTITKNDPELTKELMQKKLDSLNEISEFATLELEDASKQKSDNNNKLMEMLKKIKEQKRDVLMNLRK